MYKPVNRDAGLCIESHCLLVLIQNAPKLKRAGTFDHPNLATLYASGYFAVAYRLVRGNFSELMHSSEAE